MSKVLARPSPNYKTLMSAAVNKEDLNSDLLFFHLGREALLHGLRLLDIEPGSAIVVPAYMCDSNISPLRQLGYKVIFVDINNDLSNNLEDIEFAIRKYNAKAVLAVHYFGFPSNIDELAKLCRLLQIKLIEDCAHSLLTKINGVPVGSSGHVGIYSMRKTLPVPDGGALKVNNKIPVSAGINLYNFGRFKGLRYIISRMLESLIFNVGYPNIYSAWFTYLKDRIRELFLSLIDEDNMPSLVNQVKPSLQLQAYLNDSNYLSKIAETRRSNYNCLVRELKKMDLCPWMPILPSECVPQFLTLSDEKGGLLDWLRDHGVGAINWPGPELSIEITNRRIEFPVTNDLNDRLVMLPIHQSISKKNCKYMIELIRKWSLAI